MVYIVKHFINGHTYDQDESSHDLYNPATNLLQGRVYNASTKTINAAVTAANNAFLPWSQTPLSKRAQLLFGFKMLLQEHLDELAQLVTLEHGKTIEDAKGSIQRGLAVLDFACGIPNHLKGELSLDVSNGVDCYSMRQPLGVCVGITPFNFPAMIPLWMFSLAIACGNTFVLKPSEKDPSCGLRLAELMKEAGFPPGVFNVIQGDKSVVEELIVHPMVRAISFVGSSLVAQSIYTRATHHHKRVQAFGGAKNHCIVMPDADIAYTVDSIMGAAYGSAGERCMAISVVVAVGDQLANLLIHHLSKKMKNLSIGDGRQAVDIGPLITQAHLAKVTAYIELGVDEGAKLIVDGREASFPKQGNFLGASLFDQVTPAMKIYQEEIFGPVLCVVRAPDFDSALKLVNEHPYGNGAAIFTSDPSIARTFSKEAKAGMIGINIPIPVPAAQFSFGGWKKSLFGDLHLYGPEGIQFYTQLKTVTARWPGTKSNGPEYALE